MGERSGGGGGRRWKEERGIRMNHRSISMGRASLCYSINGRMCQEVTTCLARRAACCSLIA